MLVVSILMTSAEAIAPFCVVTSDETQDLRLARTQNEDLLKTRPSVA
jgi:hypothetical protein